MRNHFKIFGCLAAVILLLVSIGTSFYFIWKPQIFKSKTSEPVKSKVLSASIQTIANNIFTDDFETDLSAWQIIAAPPNTFELITPPQNIGIKSGQKVLQVSYSGQGGMWIEHPLGNSINGTVSIWFYDSLDRKAGTFIAIYDQKEDQAVVLGLKTDSFPDTYYYRAGPNSSLYGRNSNFPRSLGWHKFELVSTPVGSYGKIDGRNLSYLPNAGIAGAVNSNLKNFSKIKIASTWGLGNNAYYDNLVISELPVLPSVIDRQKHFMNLFVNQPMPSYAEWRAKADKAVNLALLGKYSEAQQLISQIADEDLAAYAQTNFIGSQRSWGHTLTMNPLGMAAWLSWSQLDNETKQKITLLVKREADFWAGLIDKIKATPTAFSRDFQDNQVNTPVGYYNVPYISFISRYKDNTSAEESSWRASFLALAANMFPDDPNAQKWDIAAKTFAFHTFSTGETYNGITSKTIYYNDEDNNGQKIPNYLLANHGFLPHQQYALGGGIDEFSRGALFYLKVGKPIPEEFKHNVINVWNAHQPHIDKQTHLFKNSRLSDTFGGKDDWGGDDTWYNSAYAYHDLLTGNHDIDELSKFEFYIKGDYSAFSAGGYNPVILQGTLSKPNSVLTFDGGYSIRASQKAAYDPNLIYLLDSVVAFRNASSLAFLDPSVTLTPITITPSITPISLQVSSVTFNGQVLNLSGQPVTAIKLTDQNGPVNVPVIINYTSGETKNLIIRFNYEAPSSPTCTITGTAITSNKNAANYSATAVGHGKNIKMVEIFYRNIASSGLTSSDFTNIANNSRCNGLTCDVLGSTTFVNPGTYEITCNAYYQTGYVGDKEKECTGNLPGVKKPGSAWSDCGPNSRISTQVE